LLANCEVVFVKAIVQDTYGSADVLDFRDVAAPSIGDHEVLVHVVAAGVDRGAWHFMTGQPYLMRTLGLDSAHQRFLFLARISLAESKPLAQR
jgi:hypothetical protein